MQGIDCVFQLAALWLDECVHEPRQALGGERRRHLQRGRGGARGRRQADRLLLVGLGLRQRGVTPMTEDHPFNNRTMYGATKIANEQFFRAFYEQHGLDYIGHALHEHLRPAHGLRGHLRQRDHEGARPHLCGRAAGRSSATAARSTTSSTSSDVARANILAHEGRRRPTSSSTSAPASARPSTSWSACCSRSPASALEPEYRPQEQMLRHPPHRQHRAGRAAARLPADVALRDGLESVVEWRRATAPLPSEPI